MDILILRFEGEAPAVVDQQDAISSLKVTSPAVTTLSFRLRRSIRWPETEVVAVAADPVVNLATSARVFGTSGEILYFGWALSLTFPVEQKATHSLKSTLLYYRFSY